MLNEGDHLYNMAIFATTEHLNLRAYCQDRDLAHILDLWNDPLVQITGSSEYPRPHTEKWALDVLGPQLDAALLAIVIESREGIRGTNANGAASEDENPFVGYALLQLDHRRNSNRDAVLAIALYPGWWGRGYGTQAAKWVVDHAFRALGMHRVSLAVLDTNKRAIALYKRM